MKTILLTQGKAAIVDDLDYPRLNTCRWGASCRRGHWYAVRYVGRRVILMHREILGLLAGDAWGDHINGDGLDNQRHNLRPATPTENHGNARRYRNNMSGFKGVSPHLQSTKFQVSIKAYGTAIYLGLFADPVDAALIYDEAARQLFGQFAALNFPNIGERSA